MDNIAFDRAKHSRDLIAYEALGILRGHINAPDIPESLRVQIARLETEYTSANAALTAAVESDDRKQHEVEAEQAALRG